KSYLVKTSLNFLLLKHVHLFLADTAPTLINPLSLHDALPIFHRPAASCHRGRRSGVSAQVLGGQPEAFRAFKSVARNNSGPQVRSEEHTSELQSRENLVCRLLLEKKNHILCKYQRNCNQRRLT